MKEQSARRSRLKKRLEKGGDLNISEAGKMPSVVKKGEVVINSSPFGK